jgi:Fe-S cluster biosynthesis and repair protein YggX
MRVKDGIASILTESGIELPTVEQAAPGETGKPLDKEPLPGKIGKWILENVDEAQWDAWIGQGTKVINELRLDFSRVEDQSKFEEHMAEFLGIPANIIAKDVEDENK